MGVSEWQWLGGRMDGAGSAKLAQRSGTEQGDVVEWGVVNHQPPTTDRLADPPATS